MLAFHINFLAKKGCFSTLCTNLLPQSPHSPGYPCSLLTYQSCLIPLHPNLCLRHHIMPDRPLLSCPFPKDQGNAQEPTVSILPRHVQLDSNLANMEANLFE